MTTARRGSGGGATTVTEIVELWRSLGCFWQGFLACWAIGAAAVILGGVSSRYGQKLLAERAVFDWLTLLAAAALWPVILLVLANRSS